jgi:predicted hydrocarbon binding protein
MERKEKLGRKARVRAGVLRAHLEWARKRWPDVAERLRSRLDAPSFSLVKHPPSSDEEMIPFRRLVRLDRALAALAGGDHEGTFHALGVHSAQHSLKSLPAAYEPELPHRFFESMAVMHRMYQDFGKSRYERLAERSGRIQIARYSEYSPTYCIGGRGYYEEALRLMRVPGPVKVEETTCQCAGDAACLFILSW